MNNRLPPAPRKRTFGLPVRRQQPVNTMERLRTMGRRHEEEERPFDPERSEGRWRGSSRDLVVNASQFYSDLREMVAQYHGHLNTELSVDEIVDEIKRAIKEEKPWAAMRRADELLEGHGVEAIGPVNMRDGPPYTYINFGDPYVSTLMWSRDDNKFFVGSWGDIVPEMESSLLEEEWGSWLQRDFTKKVLSGLEDDEFDDLERAEEILDSWDADAFSKLVRDTQQNTKSSSGKYPEITTESEGIYVHNLSTVVDRAVELFKEKRYSPNAADEYEGLVLLFSTSADPSRAARLHAESCPMVNTGRRGGMSPVKLIRDDLAATVADLNERGFPVKRCKCCRSVRS